MMHRKYGSGKVALEEPDNRPETIKMGEPHHMKSYLAQTLEDNTDLRDTKATSLIIRSLFHIGTDFSKIRASRVKATTRWMNRRPAQNPEGENSGRSLQKRVRIKPVPH